MDRAHFTATMLAYRNRKPFHPFTVVLLNNDRFEVDFPDAFNVRDGLGVFIAPGGIPHIFDYEGVVQIIGDLSDRPSESA